MSTLTKDQIQQQLKLTDDVFHRLIVALERYEAYIEKQRTGEEKNSLVQTAMHSSRDEHDYTLTPTGEVLYRELRLQCVSLNVETVYDDDEISKISNQLFLEDLLEWYGGREDSIPYNEIDAFAYPIICSVCQLAKSPEEVKTITENYIRVLPQIEKTGEEIMNGLAAWIKGADRVQHSMEKNKEEDDDIITSHRRGNAIDGYYRLFASFIYLFDDVAPAKNLCKIVTDFIPDLASSCKSVNPTAADELYERKKTKEQSEDVDEPIPFESVVEKSEQEQVSSPTEDWLSKARELYEILKRIFEK